MVQLVKYIPDAALGIANLIRLVDLLREVKTLVHFNNRETLCQQ